MLNRATLAGASKVFFLSRATRSNGVKGFKGLPFGVFMDYKHIADGFRLLRSSTKRLHIAAHDVAKQWAAPDQ